LADNISPIIAQPAIGSFLDFSPAPHIPLRIPPPGCPPPFPSVHIVTPAKL
jgi:hypothetical protein